MSVGLRSNEFVTECALDKRTEGKFLVSTILSTLTFGTDGGSTMCYGPLWHQDKTEWDFRWQVLSLSVKALAIVTHNYNINIVLSKKKNEMKREDKRRLRWILVISVHWRLRIIILFYFYCFVQPLMPFNHKTDDVSNYNRRNKLKMPVSHFTFQMEHFPNWKENNGMKIRNDEWASGRQQYGLVSVFWIISTVYMMFR